MFISSLTRCGLVGNGDPVENIVFAGDPTDPVFDRNIGDAEPLIVRQEGIRHFTPDSAISVAPLPDKIYRFDKDGKPIRH